MHNTRPYILEGGEPPSLCTSCYHSSRCKTIGNSVYDCSWHETASDIMTQKERESDIIKLAKTPQGARQYLRKINEVIFCEEPYTGNAGTTFNLGMRRLVMNEINELMTALDLAVYTDLIIYLSETASKRRD